jgi:hypothetical protein
MHKVRLAVVLPVIQFSVATTLLQWGYRAPAPNGLDDYVPAVHRICWGLNAPTLPFGVLDTVLWRYWPASGWQGWSVLHLYPGDVFFLAGVVVVWYLVGRGLDRRRFSETPPKHRAAVAVAGNLLLLALGGLLFFKGLADLAQQRLGYLEHVGGLLTLAWSVSLIFLSGRGLAVTVRRAFRAAT